MTLYEKVIEIFLRDQNTVIDPEHAKEMCDMVTKALKEMESKEYYDSRSGKELYEFQITVYSYKDVVDEFQEKNNLTREEVTEMLAGELQINAWGDAYPVMQETIAWENSEEGKKFIAEQEAKAANVDD